MKEHKEKAHESQPHTLSDTNAIATLVISILAHHEITLDEANQAIDEVRLRLKNLSKHCIPTHSSQNIEWPLDELRFRRPFVGHVYAPSAFEPSTETATSTNFTT